jgi:transposase
MIEALIAGRTAGAELAGLARGRLRGKSEQLERALEGRVRQHHRLMLELHYGRIRQAEKFIEDVEGHIEQYVARMQCDERGGDNEVPFASALSMLTDIPGINRCVAIALLAEIGTNMSRFPTAAHLASWAGMCPGQNESAGKRKSGRTTGGNRWVRRAITQAAWAASHSKQSFFRARFHRLAARRGKKRAIVAVAHSLLITIHNMLSSGAVYEDLGADYYERTRTKRLTNYYVKRLTALGHNVVLEPAA